MPMSFTHSTQTVAHLNQSMTLSLIDVGFGILNKKYASGLSKNLAIARDALSDLHSLDQFQ